MIPKYDLKKIVLIMTIGLCEAIRSKTITVDEAEYYLFSPRTMSAVEYDEELKEIIHLCTELDNIARLIPEALEDKLAEITQRAATALASMPPCEYRGISWLTELLRPVQK
jgi:hypothetical protein